MENLTMCKYAINDRIMYLTTGLCHIDDIRDECFGGAIPRKYYVMHAINDSKSVIYVPVDSEKLTAGMHPLLTPDEISGIISSVKDSDVVWIHNNKQRALSYTEKLGGGDRAEILMTIKALYLHKKELESQKKKFYASDERVLFAASRLISEEFAFVLQMDQKDVMPYILEKLGIA